MTESCSNSIHTAIADDHKMIIQGIQAMLEGERFAIKGSAISLNDLDILLKTQKIDLLILDINFDGDSSLDRIESIKFNYPQMKIVICTSYDSSAFVADALGCGVHGYVLKDITKYELIDILDRIMDGEIVVHDKIHYNKHKSNLILSDGFGKFHLLTTREKEITKCLMELKKTDQIARIMYLSPSTVQTHRKNIFKKLGIHSVAGLIKTYQKMT